MNNTSFASKLATQASKRKTFTENGAVAYASSGKEMLDFNFKLSQYRKMSESEIERDFSKVFYESPLLSVKFMFYVGDVRGGLGERKVFRTCMSWLATEKTDVAKVVIPLIPEYTRWDNLVVLAEISEVRDLVLDIIVAQLSEDLANMREKKPISLLAKWMPSVNASSKKTRRRAMDIIREFKISPKDYRKTLSQLRAYLDVVEVKTSANEWDKIDYESVPSQANIKYASAFFKHDEDRRLEYLKSLSRGEAKINASVAQPHEIVAKYYNESSSWRRELKRYDEALEQIWKALPDVSIEDTIVVRDGSASMTSRIGNGKTTCLDVATALAIYCSEHNSKDWENVFVTFSSYPEFVDLSNCKSLRDKIKRCDAEDDCSNTNIQATMELILETAVANGVKPENMPENILIISDMQFDPYSKWYHFGWDKTLFEQISDDYKEAGYKLPKIIFWNVSDRNSDTIPMQDNERGLVLCSGFSINNMKMFMSGEIDPYKVLLEQLNSKRYQPVELAIKNLF